MIKEQKDKFKYREYVTRICDACGKEEAKTYGEIVSSKLKKKLNKDYCKECSYDYRFNPQKKGKESPFWKNGLTLNKTSGYLRICNTGEYYHKIIFGDFLGRKITKEEQVHHIDFNKLNNEINNLFLCKNKREHYLLHYKIELFVLSLLDKFVYFDRKNKIYTTFFVKNEKIDFKFNNSNIKSIVQCTWRNGKKYAFGYLGNRKHRILHGLIYEQFLDRRMKKGENIHHINGDTLDNDINNLILLTKSEHKICHNSLWDCAKQLIENNIIQFNNGEYYCG